MPRLILLGGPNGAGKTTAAMRILPGFLSLREYVNADTIAAGISAFVPESVAVEAGRVMLRRLRELAEMGADFAFETTLASPSFARFLRNLQGNGYDPNTTKPRGIAPGLALTASSRPNLVGQR
jgi:predicted ABC-type ATPase